MKDALGDRMKQFENLEGDRRAVKSLPLLARLDGRSFHNFTKGLKRPYDENLSQLMIATTVHLVEETNALVSYTQSDEISLAWFVPEESCSQYLFDGRFQKLTSILGAMATGYFVHNLEATNVLPTKKGQIPLFDARVWQVPSLDDAYDAFRWREKDAVKNSVTMAASVHFSHKSLQNVGSTVKKQMLIDVGDPWEAQPDFFKRGTYVKRIKIMKELDQDELEAIPENHRPSGPVARTVVAPIQLSLLNDKIPWLFAPHAPFSE